MCEPVKLSLDYLIGQGQEVSVQKADSRQNRKNQKRRRKRDQDLGHLPDHLIATEGQGHVINTDLGQGHTADDPGQEVELSIEGQGHQVEVVTLGHGQGTGKEGGKV